MTCLCGIHLSAESRERLDAFWSRSSLGRPALSILVRNPDFIPVPFDEGGRSRKELELDPAWQAYEASESLDRTICLAEATPKATLQFGSNIALLPALLGADYDFSVGTAWVHPMPRFLDHPMRSFDPNLPLVRHLTAGMEAIAGVCRDRALLNPPAFGLDAWTIMSLLMGSDKLCLQLLDNPEPLAARQKEMTRFYIDAYEYFHGVARRLGSDGSATWYDCAAPGRFEAVQCDFSVFISPDLFKEYVLPDLSEVLLHTDHALYHLDGVAQLRFLDLLQGLKGLDGIQWNPEPRAQDPTQWLDTFLDIRERGWLLYFNRAECRSVEHAVAIIRAVGPDGLFLALPEFETIGEAEAAIAAISEAAKLR